MTDRPILFSAPMVRALLADRKTQTRRILKPQPECGYAGDTPYFSWNGFTGLWPDDWQQAKERNVKISVGDRLWVRETWSGEHEFHDIKPSERKSFVAGEGVPYFRENVWFWADGNPDFGDWERPRPAIHMPRWASRITLIVTDVRVERLQDISEEDAFAEGAYRGKASGRFADNYVAMAIAGDWFATARAWYRNLWDRINGAGAWDKNPWVIAYTFRVIKQNIDQIEKVAA